MQKLIRIWKLDGRDWISFSRTHRGSTMRRSFSWSCPAATQPCKHTQPNRHRARGNPRTTRAGRAMWWLHVNAVLVWVRRSELLSPASYCDQTTDLQFCSWILIFILRQVWLIWCLGHTIIFSTINPLYVGIQGCFPFSVLEDNAQSVHRGKNSYRLCFGGTGNRSLHQWWLLFYSKATCELGQAS